MNDDYVNILITFLDKIIIVEFNINKNSFYLAKKFCNREEIKSKVFELISSVSEGQEFDKIKQRCARNIWSELCEQNFQQVQQLDNITNQTKKLISIEDPNLVVYKIRDKNTRLYSKGGMNGNKLWSENGKSWNTLGHIKLHINNLKGDFRNSSKIDLYDNSEIVVMKEVKRYDIQNMEKIKK